MHIIKTQNSKIIKGLIFLIIFVVSLVSIYQFFDEINKFIFVGGSMSSITEMLKADKYISLALSFICLFTSLFYLKHNNSILAYCLIIFLFIWFLNGRTVGFLAFPDGKIITGWFMIPTSEFLLCDHKIDCETSITQQTNVKKDYLWKIYIENSSTQKEIFLGPFLWTKGYEFFENKVLKSGQNPK